MLLQKFRLIRPGSIFPNFCCLLLESLYKRYPQSPVLSWQVWHPRWSSASIAHLCQGAMPCIQRCSSALPTRGSGSICVWRQLSRCTNQSTCLCEVILQSTDVKSTLSCFSNWKSLQLFVLMSREKNPTVHLNRNRLEGNCVFIYLINIHSVDKDRVRPRWLDTAEVKFALLPTGFGWNN